MPGWGLARDRGLRRLASACGGVAVLAGAALLGLRLADLLRRRRAELGGGEEHEPSSSAAQRCTDDDELGSDAIATAEELTPELEDIADKVTVGANGRPTDWGRGEVRRRRTAEVAPAHSDCDSPALGNGTGALLPGKQRIYVKTYGCAHNSSDSEFMMGLLRDYGYVLADALEDADACLVNSCTVKSPSQDSAVNLTKRARAEGKPVVLAGCVPSADASLAERLQDVSMLGVTQLDRVVEVVEEALNGHVVQLLGKKRTLPSLDLPKVRRNSCVEIIPISGGCLGNCSYCKTKHARGKLSSYTEEAILGRALQAASEGASEVWLTSEDTGAYGLDIGTNIASLLANVADSLPPGVMLKLGMTNPPYILAHLDAVAQVMRRPNVFGFIHVPVQSGSDQVLRAMVREYTVEDFRRLLGGLRAAVPDLLVATDVICGFPTEGEEDHELSLQLVREFRFPVLNISQFYPRPGTAAARMRKLPGSVVKRRSTEMTQLFESYGTHSALVGREEQVWFSETDTRHGQTIGHTKGYAKVVVDRNDALLGRGAIVKIDRATKWHVEGKVLRGSF